MKFNLIKNKIFISVYDEVPYSLLIKLLREVAIAARFAVLEVPTLPALIESAISTSIHIQNNINTPQNTDLPSFFSKKSPMIIMFIK